MSGKKINANEYLWTVQLWQDIKNSFINKTEKKMSELSELPW